MSDSDAVNEPRRGHSKILDWPEDDRPREKLLQKGSEALTEAELLAILIRTGTRNATAVDVAKALLKEYKTLKRLSQRTVQELAGKKFPGFQNAKIISVVAAFELGKRLAGELENEKKHRMDSPELVAQYFIPKMREMKQESFIVLLLDSACHLLRDVEITKGILNSSLVHPREVFRVAINEPAASIILLHNHPSGNPEPSAEDMQVTKQLIEAGKIIGIPIHDHIIIAGNLYTSLAERGLL